MSVDIPFFPLPESCQRVDALSDQIELLEEIYVEAFFVKDK